MEIIQDIIYTNKKVIRGTFKNLIKNWPIIFTGLFYSTATLILALVLPFFWILAGLVLIVSTSALISNYLYLINCIIERGSFKLDDFKSGFTAYLSKIWGILFIGYVASIIINTLLMPGFRRGFNPMGLGVIINFLAFVLFNALPETIYQKHYNLWESIKYTVEFVRDNWIEWFIPNLILILLLYLFTGKLLLGIFNYHLPFRVSLSPLSIILYIVGQIWLSFMMIYRGYLFEILSTSNRRKRLFMREL